MIRHADNVDAVWLGEVLGEPVVQVSVEPGCGHWSRQATLGARLADGTQRRLRLKTCLGPTFGRSEVDYYSRDYIDLPDAPLVRCFDAQFQPGVGYHLLLEDLGSTHGDCRDMPPTLGLGLAIAEALASLHRHHWQSARAPDEAALDRYIDEIRPGIAAMEAETGRVLRASRARHEQAFRRRWADPHGMSLLHGDLNPTNVLAPRQGSGPVYFIDRQPFGWSLTYGVAAWDLAYATAPWWPEPVFRQHQAAILRRWYDCLGQPGYGWEQAQADWRLSLAQCLDVPLQWCARPETLAGMRWLWQAQRIRVEAALLSTA